MELNATQELQGPKAGRCLYNGNLGWDTWWDAWSILERESHGEVTNERWGKFELIYDGYPLVI